MNTSTKSSAPAAQAGNGGAFLRLSETTLPYGFFIKNANLEAVAMQQLAEDADSATLSRIFQWYYRLRPWMPIKVRQLLQRRRKAAVPVEDDWYIPDRFVRALADGIDAEAGALPVVHPWPHGAPFGFVLTHDVETKDGVQRILRLAALEEELGFRSSWNVVPYKYAVDPGLIRELKGRGFEMGVHGYNHDGRLFSSRKTFQRRAVAINRALADLGAVGFRSPMVHRNLEWLQALDIDYDASYFDVDPLQAMPGGVGSLWPFLVGKFVELPYTLPQDHTLFIVLGQDDGAIWERKLDYIARHRGMALMVTHPDYLDSPRRLDVYRRFLEHVRDLGDCWHGLPRDAARWWRQREQSEAAVDRSGGWRVDGPAQPRGRVVNVGCIFHGAT